MRCCCGQIEVVGTPKNLQMCIGRRCVVEGGVRTGGSGGFIWKTVQQIFGSVEALYPILCWHGTLKE
jgi:hypothetical protein